MPTEERLQAAYRGASKPAAPILLDSGFSGESTRIVRLRILTGDGGWSSRGEYPTSEKSVRRRFGAHIPGP